MTRIFAALHFNGKLPDEEPDPSPLAGVQPKLAPFFLEGQYFQPKPGSHDPTTHILKVSPRSLSTEDHMILWGSRFDYSQKIRSWNVQHSGNYDQFYNVNPPKPFLELRNERLS